MLPKNKTRCRRRTALALVLTLAGGPALAGRPDTGPTCINAWEQPSWSGPTCKALALKQFHTEQWAALQSAEKVLADTASRPANAGTPAVMNALEVVRESIVGVMRDYRPPQLAGQPAFNVIAALLGEIRTTFTRQGWPVPADLSAGLQFLQDRLRVPRAPDQAAALLAAAELAARLSENYGTLIRDIVRTRTAADFAAHRAAKEMASDTYFNRVVDRVTGAGRFESAVGLFGFLKELLILGLTPLMVGVWRVRRQGWINILCTALPLAVAPALAGMPVYMLYVFTGLPGGLAFVLLLPLMVWVTGAVLRWLPVQRLSSPGSVR